MSPVILAILGASGLTLVATLLLRFWRRRYAALVFKMLTSSGFVALALLWGASGSRYGQVMLAGLVLAWLGDLFLGLKPRWSFLAGLVAFLLGHLAYAAAFSMAGLQVMAAAGALLALIVLRRLVLRWLLPHVGEKMKLPVNVYAAVISVMLAFAAGALPVLGWPVLAGALFFYVSDLAVARGRFVAPGFVNELWGLPLYYLGQFLLAWTVSATL